MNLLTYIMHLATSGAAAYYLASQIRDSKTRPDILTNFHLSESGSISFLSTLSVRAADEGDTWLAEKLAKHASDEIRHSQIFAHALKQMNKEVTDLKNQPQDTSVSKSQQQHSPFFLAYFKDYTLDQLKPNAINWDVFMGSTYILEVDAGKDFTRMAKVLPNDELTTRNLKRGMLSIAQDETGHAAYLYEAMLRRMSATQAEKLIEQWRTRKVNAIFSMVGNIF